MPLHASNPDIPAIVGHILRSELAARRSEVVRVDSRLGPLVDALINFTLQGGKRLRPRFMYWGWRSALGSDAVGPDAEHGVLRAAAALELIQSCALIHDDIIDRSETRRGEPSTHRFLTKTHAEQGLLGDSDHFGVSLAVLLGDLALAWADDLFTDAALHLGRAPACLSAWRAMRTEVLAGQMLDIAATADNGTDPDQQIADAMTVNRYKTAAYTIERPLHLGAALAGASQDQVAALRAYGADIGIAFQLRDDLLGVFGDAAITGKPAGDDLMEGKHTVLLAMARKYLSSQEELLAELDAGVGVMTGPAKVTRLAQLIQHSGAVADIEARITDLTRSGLAAIEHAGLEPVAKSALVQLAQAATKRSF